METPKIPIRNMDKPNLPTLNELFEGVEKAGAFEGLNAILNANPPQSWVKEHPFIKNHRYLPIDKVEYLLRKIFKHYSIAITGHGTAFNGVWVTVRVSYLNPVTGQMESHDGIGSAALQLRAQTKEEKEQNIKVQFNSENINNGALSMAFPLAKTLAIKDACQLIGNIFGANLDRKDTIEFKPDEEILSREQQRKQLLKANGIEN